MEKLKDKIILHALLKYGFHFLLFVTFFFAAENLYPEFQNFLINNFSKINYYQASLKSGVFFGILVFVIICHLADFLIVRKYGLKGYTIVYPVLLDICCLFISNLVIVIFNNIVIGSKGLVDLESLNNIIIIGAIVVLKNLLVMRYLKHSQKKALLAGQIPA